MDNQLVGRIAFEQFPKLDDNTYYTHGIPIVVCAKGLEDKLHQALRLLEQLNKQIIDLKQECDELNKANVGLGDRVQLQSNQIARLQIKIEDMEARQESQTS